MPCSDAGEREYERKERYRKRQLLGMNDEFPELPWEIIDSCGATIAAFVSKATADEYVRAINGHSFLKVLKCPC